MVAGASKRGWTTWTVGAVDKRVRAIAPLVMDILKLNDQMHSHFMNLGGWTFAFQDYWWENNTYYVDTAAMGDMCQHIDPWSYRYRYRDRDIKTYVVNTGGDEFFLIDDNHQYFTEMPTKDDNWLYQRYLRNAEHSMAIHALSNQHIYWSLYDLFLYSMLPQESGVVTPKTVFRTWETLQNKITGPVTIGHVRFESDQKPETVNFYIAGSKGMTRRDFRLVHIGCLDKTDPGAPYDTEFNPRDPELCDCKNTTQAAEARGEDIQGICQQLLLWNEFRDKESILINADLKEVDGEKYQYAWEGTLEVPMDNPEKFRAGFIEFKYPALNSENSPSDRLPLPDRVPRGEGLTVSSRAVITPNIKPNPNCGVKDGDDLAYDCEGSLV